LELITIFWLIIDSSDCLKDVPIELFLKLGKVITGFSLGLVEKLAISLAPLLLHHLLSPFILESLLLFLLLPALLILLFLEVLLLSSSFVAFFILTFIFVSLFIKELHLMNKGVRAYGIDELFNLGDHAQYISLSLFLLTRTDSLLIAEYLQILLTGSQYIKVYVEVQVIDVVFISN